MLERINRIIEEKQMSTTQFADYINIQRPTMSHIISGRNNPSLDIVMKILTAFPDIDSDWLMFGGGEMYKNESLKEENSNKQPEKTVSQDTKQALDMMDLFSTEETAEELEETEIENIVQNEVTSFSQEPVQDLEEVKSEMREEDTPVYYNSKTGISDSPENSNINNVRKETENDHKKEKKQIRKIVFFYSDKSFCEYYPEN